MDCNKTINFLHEFKRLCDSRDECVANADNEEDCPMFGVCRLTHSKLCAENIKTAIETVQKWSDEHPKKTYAQDFLRSFQMRRDWKRLKMSILVRVEVQYTPESVRGKDAMNAGTSQWRNDNG